ncbi:ZIP family metal transporter [Pseudalkalibacillus caeni]|uniref:ZIP family metal transporter n=1 Tax=Exobacillus caeni TaxID=2574798 RepID=UPI0014854E51|nr:ZIP family metal transporter [Pseudalkalibacillus caeni]
MSTGLPLAAVITLAGWLGYLLGTILKGNLPISIHRANLFCGCFLIGLILFGFLPHLIHSANPLMVKGGLIAGAAGYFLFHRHTNERKREGSSHVSPVFLYILALAAHNFPMGLAIGAQIGANAGLAGALLLMVLFHHLPEGFVMNLLMNNNRKAFLAGLILAAVVGLGTFIGFSTGTISGNIIGLFALLGGISFGMILATALKDMIWPATSKVSLLSFLAIFTSGIALPWAYYQFL